jgi:hypothetical protein
MRIVRPVPDCFENSVYFGRLEDVFDLVLSDEVDNVFTGFGLLFD